jgi:hypothetical protein
MDSGNRQNFVIRQTKGIVSPIGSAIEITEGG